MRFLKVKAPTKGELTRLTHAIAQRVGRYLERQGLLERDTGDSYLTAGLLNRQRIKHKLHRRNST